jgi:hypothetical protein
MTTLFHGTSQYTAAEMVDNQAVNVARIAEHQADKAFNSGLYTTSQQATANYYADLLFGTGRAGGPAIVQIDVPTASFSDFAERAGISVEAPVPHPPMPGQTETFIPFDSLGDFNNIPGLKFSIVGGH